MNKHIPCKRCSGGGFINLTFSGGNTASYICPDCNGSGVLVVSMTNGDRIRDMSDEELAAFLSEFKDCGGGCLVGKGVKDCSGLCATADTLKIWLQQLAEEDDHESV